MGDIVPLYPTRVLKTNVSEHITSNLNLQQRKRQKAHTTMCNVDELVNAKKMHCKCNCHVELNSLSINKANLKCRPITNNIS